MTAEVSKLERQLARMVSRLPRDLSPVRDLWPGIEAEIDVPDEREFRRLPRDVEVPRDLWPSIQARIDAPLTRTSRGAGVAAVAAIVLVIAIQVGNLVGSDGFTATSADVPVWMDDLLDPFSRAAPGTTQAELGETARSIRRDFLMVRSERLMIEQELVVSAGDNNLRAQWRQVYMAELRLIDEAQKLGTQYATRIET